jgi:hypothetical protein
MALAVAGVTSLSFGQVYTPGTPPPAPVYVPAPAPQQPGVYQAPPAVQSASLPRLSDQQLADMTASIALYPDPLLAQILPAATYVDHVVKANEWVRRYPHADERSIQQTGFVPSVKALMHYPTVLAMMAENADWTRALGIAFMYQPSDLTNSIQRWRSAALAAGTLASNDQQQVVTNNGLIQILPAQPQAIYVPAYDPAIVYVRGPHARDAIHFQIGTFGVWLDGQMDWHDHVVTVPSRPYWERNEWDDRRHEWVVRTDVHKDEERRPFVRNDFHDDGHYPDRVTAPDHRDIHMDWRGASDRDR